MALNNIERSKMTFSFRRSTQQLLIRLLHNKQQDTSVYMVLFHHLLHFLCLAIAREWLFFHSHGLPRQIHINPKYMDNVRKKKKAERGRENETIKASEWVSGKAHDEFGGKNNGQNQRGIKHF